MSRPTTELAHLFRALKAPAAARALPKLADRARAEEWSYEQFAATLLKCEIDSRDSHGGQARIKAARFPARKTIEEFDCAFQTSLRRDSVLHLAQPDFLAGTENVILLGPPAPATRTSRSRWGSAPAWPASASCSGPRPSGSPSSPTPNATDASTKSSASSNASRCSSATRSTTSPSIPRPRT